MADDSDDDRPISSIIANKIAKVPVKVETKKGDDSDDDKPISSIIAAKMKDGSVVKTEGAPKPKGPTDGGAASDSEDDLPIAELMKRRLKAAAKSNGAPPAKKIKVESNGSKSRPSSSSAPASSSSKSIGGTQLSVDFYETSKGLLAQRLLCRWWYAIEWPKVSELQSPPPGYESLDGFPGVFVCTRVSNANPNANFNESAFPLISSHLTNVSNHPPIAFVLCRWTPLEPY
jgi:hypothetical protein